MYSTFKESVYIDGFGYVAPSKTKPIIAGSDGDINKMVGTMEKNSERISRNAYPPLLFAGNMSIKLRLYVF